MKNKDNKIYLFGKIEDYFGLCSWCGKPLKGESDIYKVRGDFVCRECVERMYEERED